MDTAEPIADHVLPGLDNSYNGRPATFNHVILKGNRIYRHSIIRINYTTYDVRRGQDSFNPSGSKRDIMLLAGQSADDTDSEAVSHRFRYARIVGIYHVNVQYVGPGLKDYNPRRLDVLHVRWFQLVLPDPRQDGVELSMLQFVSLNEDHAFGFVDPAEVLRGCHVIPAFAKGKRQPDDPAISCSRKDSDNWRCYYVNRYDTYV